MKRDTVLHWVNLSEGFAANLCGVELQYRARERLANVDNHHPSYCGPVRQRATGPASLWLKIEAA